MNEVNPELRDADKFSPKDDDEDDEDVRTVSTLTPLMFFVSLDGKNLLSTLFSRSSKMFDELFWEELVASREKSGVVLV